MAKQSAVDKDEDASPKEPLKDTAPLPPRDTMLPEKREVTESRDEVLPKPAPAVRAHAGAHREVVSVTDPITGRTRSIPSRLSRAGMIQVINNGGSFHLPPTDFNDHEGIRVISKLDQIPSEAELAQMTGSPDELDRAVEENEAAMRRLSNSTAQLKKARATLPAAKK